MNEINFDDFHKEISHAENYLRSSRETLDLKGNPSALNFNAVDDTKDYDSVDSIEMNENTDSVTHRTNSKINHFDATFFFASDLTVHSSWETYANSEPYQNVGNEESSVSTVRADSLIVESLNIDPQNVRKTSPMKYLKSRDDLVNEDKEKFNKNYPFKPSIVSNSGQFNSAQRGLHVPTLSSANKRVVRKPKYFTEEKSSPEAKLIVTTPIVSHRIEELLISHKTRQDELLRQRREMELIEISNCSFTPRLSKGTNDIVSKQRKHKALSKSSRFQMQHASDDELPQSLGVDVSQRLYDEAEVRLNQRLWLANEVKQSRSVHDTFQPVINPASSGSSIDENRKPIHLRIHEMQQDKQRHMQELSSAIESSQTDMTFNPKIDPRSKIMAERRLMELQCANYDLVSQKYLTDARTDVGSRLMLEGKRQARRMLVLQRDNEKILMENMMQPEVSIGTKKIAEKSSVVGANFVKRTEMLQQRRERKQEDRRRVEDELYSRWFQPTIYSDAEGILAERRPEILNESNEDRYSRMIDEFCAEKENRLKVTEKAMYGHHTFSPEIDPLSKALGRDSSIDELYDNTRGKSLRQLQRERIESVKSQECTFQPKINDISQVLGSNDRSYYNNTTQEDDERSLRYTPVRINMQEPEKMSRDIRLHLIEKEERRRADLIERELKDLQNCTFQPSIAPYQSNNDTTSGPIVVKGLGRHLELKHLSRKLREEAVQREKEAFSVVNVEKFRRPEDGSTIVKSFRFNIHRGTSITE